MINVKITSRRKTLFMANPFAVDALMLSSRVGFCIRFTTHTVVSDCSMEKLNFQLLEFLPFFCVQVVVPTKQVFIFYVVLVDTRASHGSICRRYGGK